MRTFFGRMGCAGMAATMAVAGFAAPLFSILVPLVLLACGDPPLAPRPGLPEYRELAAIALPGPARLDVAGGNLLVSREDLDLDTQLGPFSVGAVWNSASRSWTWSFDDLFFANGTFRDATGATHLVSSLGPGDAIPGTKWVKVSQAGQGGPNRLKTKGGLEYTFTTAGKPLHVRWASAPNPLLQFTQTLQGDGAFHVSSIEQCSGAPVACHPVFTIDYDAAGRVGEIIDRAGRRALFTYDVTGRLTTARDGLDVASGRPGFRYEYSNGDLTSITNSEGERVEYGYDDRRLVRATQIGEGNPVRSFEYKGTGALALYRTVATDPLGAVKVYWYDQDHQLIRVVDNSLDETTSFTWSQRRVTSRTDASGARTTWTYVDDDVSTRTDPNGNVTHFTYQPNGVDRFRPGNRPLLRATDAVGVLEERSYDASGRLVSIANGAGETVSFVYGADEMPSGFTDPAGISTQLAGYGEHGHPTSASRAGIAQSFEFDLVGNLTRGPDRASDSGPGRGGIAARHFDEDRNVVVVELADLLDGYFAGQAEPMTSVFRSDHQPLLVQRPGGGDTGFVYDPLGRLVRRSERADGTWRETTFRYDAAGRLASVDRPNGTGETWSYDSLDRMTGYTSQKGASLENAAAFVWEGGLLRAFFDSRSGSEFYTYDAIGRLRVTTYGSGDRAETFWDARSRAAGVRLTEGDGHVLRTLLIGYDAAGRERAVFDNGPPVLERTWSAGRLAETRYGNGLVRTYAFDPALGTPTEFSLKAGATTVESTSIRLNDPLCTLARQCISAQTTSEGETPATSLERHSLTPLLDPDGSVSRTGVRVGSSAIGVSGSQGNSYGYDILSNVVATDGNQLTYNDEGNRLLSISDPAGGTGVSYDYDASGFVTSRGGVPMTWDAAGRVASYGSASFVWDALGRPVSSTVDGVTTTRRFGGLVEADGAGNPRAIDLGEVRIDLAGNATRYRHFDYRGNVKLVTDEAGQVVKHYQYSAYGVEAVFGSDSDTMSFARGRTVGDLVLIGHRLYDPAAARFLAPDPPAHQPIRLRARQPGAVLGSQRRAGGDERPEDGGDDAGSRKFVVFDRKHHRGCRRRIHRRHGRRQYRPGFCANRRRCNPDLRGRPIEGEGRATPAEWRRIDLFRRRFRSWPRSQRSEQLQ